MKNIYCLPIVLIFIVLISQSCQDEFLELSPRTSRLEANSYVTENDAFLALVSAYDPIAHQEALNFIPFGADVFSDDTYTAGEPPTGGMIDKWQDMERSVLNSESPTCIRIWKRCYRGIYRANQFLNKEGGIEWKSEANRDRMVAEIKFLRAYYYYDLVRHFGWVPLVSDLISSEEAREIKQSEPEEIFTFIAKDLLEAIENLPETIEPQYYGRASKAAAQVLMARIYLHYTGFAVNELGVSGIWTDGATVIDESVIKSALEEIITNGHYRLLENYADVHSWENENNEESIFEIQYSEKSNFSTYEEGFRYLNNGNTSCYIIAPRNPQGDSTIISGWSFGTVTWSLYNEFEAGDPRLNVTIYNAFDSLITYTHGYHNTGYFNYKYMARQKYMPTEALPVHNFPKNHIDMRYAEVLLILAELYVDDNNARATELLNDVRTRSMGESAALASITLDDIYHERRVEFACEGLRYWDLLRRGLDYAKEKIDFSYIPDPSYPAPDELAGYHFDKGHKGMLPIPEDEIRNANEGVLEQKIDFYR